MVSNARLCRLWLNPDIVDRIVQNVLSELFLYINIDWLIDLAVNLAPGPSMCVNHGGVPLGIQVRLFRSMRGVQCDMIQRQVAQSD